MLLVSTNYPCVVPWSSTCEQVPPCPENQQPTPSGFDCLRCPENTVSPDGQLCVCDRGFYNTAPVIGVGSPAVCVLCTDGMNCSRPGSTTATLVLLPEYWRTGNTSTQIWPCLLEGVCDWRMNATTDETEICIEYRMGPLCQVRSKQRLVWLLLCRMSLRALHSLELVTCLYGVVLVGGHLSASSLPSRGPPRGLASCASLARRRRFRRTTCAYRA